MPQLREDSELLYSPRQHSCPPLRIHGSVSRGATATGFASRAAEVVAGEPSPASFADRARSAGGGLYAAFSWH